MTFLNLDSRWFSRIQAHLWAGFGCSAWLTEWAAGPAWFLLSYALECLEWGGSDHLSWKLPKPSKPCDKDKPVF